MAEDIVFKHLSAGAKLEAAEDDADGRHLASGAGTDDFAVFNASDLIVNKTPFTAMSTLLRSGNLLHVPGLGWNTTTVGGTAVSMYIYGQDIYNDATANSSGLSTFRAYGFSEGADLFKFNWDKKTYLIFNYVRRLSDAEAVGRVQLKEAITIGALAAKGIGLRVDNLALMGESYGTELGEVNLNTTITDQYQYQIVIVHDPSVPNIKWYVNGVLKGTQSTSAKIPSGVAGTYNHFAHSLANGATGGVAVHGYLMQLKIWQAR